MDIILEINGLSYHDFKNINLSFESKTFYSVIGSNNCGKTTLFKLIAGIIPSSDVISCNNIDLNRKNISEYITNIGIVERVNKNSFIFQKVLDEMIYPLSNLGYSKSNSLNRIIEVLELFDMLYLKDKDIQELDYYEKELLLLMIALLHQPRVLLIDSVIEIFPNNFKKKIIKVLRKLVKDNMTVICFTSSLAIAHESDKLILLDKFKVIGEYSPQDIYQNDKLFYEYNLEIPFIVDLSIKLKMYNLINKEYSDMKEMVDDIWP